MSYLHKRSKRRRSHVPMGDAVAEVTPSPGSSLAVEPTEWQQQMLATSQNQLAFLQQQEQREKVQKYLQIAATLSIPLAAAIWRAILGRRRARMSI